MFFIFRVMTYALILFCTDEQDVFVENFRLVMKKSWNLNQTLKEEDAVRIFTDLLINADQITRNSTKYKQFKIFLNGTTAEWDQYSEDISKLPQTYMSVFRYFANNRERLLDMIEKNIDYLKAIEYMGGTDIQPNL